MKTEVICSFCKKKFLTFSSAIKKGGGKFCSQNCFHKSKRKRILTKCKICGKSFETLPWKIKKGIGVYCSKRCWGLDKRNRIEICCQYCKKNFEIMVSKKETKYCSVSCRNKAMSGKNSPAWKGGISFEPYCILFNNDFKERTREFWNRKCGICGKTEEENNQKLSVHHVNYDKQSCCDSSFFNSTPNLFIPLCRGCHVKTNFNRDFWEELLANYIMIYFNGVCYIEKT